MYGQLLGIMTGVAMMVGVAHAADPQAGPRQQPGMQQPQQHLGQAQPHPEERQVRTEVEGQVVKVERRTLYVVHDGAVVPLKIDAQTQFTDPLQRPRDIQEGQLIRASFEVRGTDNIARQVASLSHLHEDIGGAGVPEDDGFDDGFQDE
jgi:hypothetical protein